jgi:hypothetical protein
LWLRELLVLGVALCGCVASCCWCLLYGFRPVSSINKPGTSFLINGWGKAFAPQFKKKQGTSREKHMTCAGPKVQFLGGDLGVTGRGGARLRWRDVVI